MVLEGVIACAAQSVPYDPRLKKLKPEPYEATPVYVQLARKLGEAIQAGDWKRNEALPSERVLCDELNVSRVTLRMALDTVEQGTPVVRALQYFRAVNLTRRLAQYLAMSEGTAVLRVVRVGYGSDSAAIELTDTYCNGDYYDFVAELKR